MKKRLLHKSLTIALLATVSTCCFAQEHFAYKARLGEAKQSAFYKILLPPQVIGRCQNDVADLRILDEQNNQVAYLLKQDAAQFSDNSFIEFPIIKKEKEKDKQTHITIENKTGKPISDLLLVTANIDARRGVNISGSNNLKEWYIIKEGVWLDNFFSTKEEELVQTISLPTVLYKYFQVTVIGHDILPFNVVKAGIYNKNYTQGKYISIPPPTISQKDSSDKRSYITLKFNEAYRINKLLVEVDGPKFYRRWVTVEDIDFMNPKTPLAVYLSPGFSEFFLGNAKSEKLLLIINNDDNIPLKIKSVSAFQLSQYMLAYLEKDKHYHLAFGDSAAQVPVYDLKFFKDSIGTNPLTISVDIIQETQQKPVAVQPKNNSGKIWLWSIIAAVSVLLLLFVFRMIKEINRANGSSEA